MKFFAVLSIFVLALAVPSFAKSLRLDPISDDEILILTKKLHDSDVNGANVVLDLQTQTTAGNLEDLAPRPLFANDLSNDFAKPTYVATFALLNNYQKNVTIQETLTDVQLAEESAFLDAVLATTVMQQLREFLSSKGDANAVDDATFKAYLNEIWFGRYAHFVEGVVASSAWEHTNVFERFPDNSIVGFHGWIYFFDEEEHGDCNYLGYIDAISTGNTTLFSMPVDLYGSTKAKTVFNIGASPELELALGTLCFIARPDQSCFVQGSNSVNYTMFTGTVTIDGIVYVEGAHPVL